MGLGHRFRAWTYCRPHPVQGQLAARSGASRNGRLCHSSGHCRSDMAGTWSLGASFDALTSLDRGGANVRVLTVHRNLG